MAAYQKRLLTAENSRLGKVDIIALLRQDDAWIQLPQDTREHLYSLLPPPDDKEGPRDPDVNPLAIEELRPHIEAELKRWQDDLRDGRETKKWRHDAMQAGKDSADGKFDEWKLVMRDEYWGRPGEGKAKADAKASETRMGEDEASPAEARGERTVKTNGVVTKEESDSETEVKDSGAGSSEL